MRSMQDQPSAIGHHHQVAPHLRAVSSTLPPPPPPPSADPSAVAERGVMSPLLHASPGAGAGAGSYGGPQVRRQANKEPRSGNTALASPMDAPDMEMAPRHSAHTRASI